MKDIGDDLVDHRRNRKHAGETMKNEQQRPGSGRGGHGRRCTDGGWFAFATGSCRGRDDVCSAGGGLTWSALPPRGRSPTKVAARTPAASS